MSSCLLDFNKSAKFLRLIWTRCFNYVVDIIMICLVKLFLVYLTRVPVFCSIYMENSGGKCNIYSISSASCNSWWKNMLWLKFPKICASILEMCFQSSCWKSIFYFTPFQTEFPVFWKFLGILKTSQLCKWPLQTEFPVFFFQLCKLTLI